jgi:hypothetical protein
MSVSFRLAIIGLLINGEGDLRLQNKSRRERQTGYRTYVNRPVTIGRVGDYTSMWKRFVNGWRGDVAQIEKGPRK